MRESDDAGVAERDLHPHQASGDWGEQGLREWRGEIDVPASPGRVWDALVMRPLLVGLIGEVDELVWDGSPGEGAGVRFELRGSLGGLFEGTCIEYAQPERICLVFMRVGRTGRAMRKVEDWVDSQSGDSPQPMIVVGHTLEQRGAQTRVEVELWTPDERLVFKSDPFMRFFMSIIVPRLYRRQIDKHLRQVRAAVKA